MLEIFSYFLLDRSTRFLVSGIEQSASMIEHRELVRDGGLPGGANLCSAE